jgi:GntR family transcriptional regulator/MocR family aminotransferase
MRRARDIEVAFGPRRKGTSLQRWLYGEIRTAILAGRLRPGARLPSTRDLAARHRLSRGTVVSVFAQLAAEGYLVAAVGQGSFVAPELPDRPPQHSPSRLTPSHPKVHAQSRVSSADAGLSTRGKLLARTAFSIDGRSLPARAFRASQPDLAAFPFELWTRIAARRSRLSSRVVLADGHACGFRPLRQVVADHLCAARGIVCSADQVVIMSTVQQVIDLSARLLLDPGDAVWMEDPGYPGARMIFEAAGAKMVGVPVDTQGMDVAAGRTVAPSARLAYVTAGRQAPLGPPLALDRRLALLAWADEADAVVIEDDYDSEYRFEGGPLAALKSLDSSGRVIYAGTFSKLLFPSLRLAYAVLPDWLVESFAAALSLTSRHAALMPQMTLHDFIAEGHFGRHMRRMRMLYAERAEVFRRAVDSHLEGLLGVPPITTGLDAPAFLPEGVDDTLVADLAAQAGVETRPLSVYAVQRPAPSGLVLGFAAIGPREIAAGAKTLAKVLEPICRVPQGRNSAP